MGDRPSEGRKATRRRPEHNYLQLSRGRWLDRHDLIAPVGQVLSFPVLHMMQLSVRGAVTGQAAQRGWRRCLEQTDS